MGQDGRISEDGGTVVDVSGVSKRFGARLAVDQAGLTLAAGEVMGFVGPNGAGKTTMLRMLSGLLRPDAGQGRVLGHDLLLSAGEIRARVGYMPQKLALYGELSVIENLRFRAEVYGLDRPGAAVEEMLSLFSLEPYARQRAGWLSGGWARRLQFAATVLHRPGLILLDEPTAGLDAIAKLEVWRRVAHFAAAGASVVINTHDLVEAEQCGRISLFNAGRIIAEGAPGAVTGALDIAVLSVEAGPDQAAELERLDGVVAVHPEGRRLRVVAPPAMLSRLDDEMRNLGLKAREDAVGLVDIEFALAEPLGRKAEAVR